MDDPWATPWGSSGKKDPMSRLSMSMSPPPEDLDVADPWAPAKSKAAAAVSSGQAAGASALASAKEGLGSARERFGPAAASASASASAGMSAFMGSPKSRMSGMSMPTMDSVSSGFQNAASGISSAASKVSMPTSEDVSAGFASVSAKAAPAMDGMSAGFASMSSKAAPAMEGMSAGFASMSAKAAPTMEGMSSGFASMSSKLPSMQDVGAGFSSAASKVSVPDMDGVSAGFSSSMAAASRGISSVGSKMTMPDASSMKMPSMPSMPDMPAGFASGFSTSSPPKVSAVEAPTFSVPTSITSSLSSFQSKVQGAATTALAGHIASQAAQASPGIPSAITNFASQAAAAHITSQASAAVTARATAATTSATASANAYTSGFASTLNSGISSFNSNVSALSSAANTASSLAASVGPKIGGLGSMPAVPSALPSWGDAWGSSSSSPEVRQEERPPTPVRSPSPPAFGDVWGAPTTQKTTAVTAEPKDDTCRSPSPSASVRSTHSTPQQDAPSRGSSPRKSLEAQLSRELSGSLAFERRSSTSRPSSPLKYGAVPDVPELAVAAPSPIPAVTGFASFGDADTAGDISSTSLAVSHPDTSMRRTPSFDSSFGGFNDGDAWGTGGASEWKKDDDWNKSTDSYGGAAEGYDSWGGVRTSTPPAEPTAQEQRWAAAQRSNQLKEQRTPYEKIEKLKREWDSVAASVIAEKDLLETMDDAEEQKLANGVKALEENVNETLHSLITLPDTRIPPLHTLETHQKYTSALTRANPNPSTSLLHMPIRTRRLEGLSFGPGLESTWGGRSRLGEPDAETAQAASAEESAPSRWSFWKKAPTPKPLVTSGGGMLEVKTPTTTTPSSPLPDAQDLASVMGAAAPRTSMSGPAGSARGSFSRPASVILPQPQSRPASPAIISPAAAAPPAPLFEDTGHSAPRHSLAEEAPAPTGVSRFFGRWGRRSTTPSISEHPQKQGVATDEDIELSNDDFAFLAEVPSMPTPHSHGTGDLLGFGGPSAPTVENVLQSSAKLPSPLAPPPRGTFRVPTPNRSSSGSSFVARMAAPRAPQQSAMDLLSGLDFDAPPSTAAPPTQSRTSSIMGWDDLLAPSSGSARATPPVIAPPPTVPTRISTPPILSPPLGRTATPPILPASASTGTRSPVSSVPSPLNMGGMAAMLPSPPATSSPATAPPLLPAAYISSPPTQTVTRMASPPTQTRTATPPSLAFVPMAPTAAWQASNQAQNSPMSAFSSPSAPIFPKGSTGLSSPPIISTAFSSTPSAPRSAAPMLSPPISATPLRPAPASPAAADTSFASFASGKTTTPLMRPGGLPSGLLATPMTASPAASVSSPAMNAPLLSGLRTPIRPAASPVTAATNNDFTDFDDFADFSTAPATNTDASGFDDFGDFGDFTSFDSPAPPLPTKTPWSAPRAWNQNTPGSPAPTPPSKSPYAPAQRSTAHGLIAGPPITASPTPAQRKAAMKTGSVDHTAALTLVTSANASPGRWPSPNSPVAPTIAPPPPRAAPSTGFLPPPPGGSKKKAVNLLDLDDLMG